MQQHDVVLVDTNVIIEAHRVGCWNQLASYFALHSVIKVIEETQAGSQNRRPETWIDQAALLDSLAHVEDVTDQHRVEFNFRYQHPALDDGERDLLVYADRLGGQPWLLNSPDMASIRFAHGQDWMDRLVSLEALNRHLKINARAALRRNYTTEWLDGKKIALRLGVAI
jgi:hypothetical protein